MKKAIIATLTKIVYNIGRFVGRNETKRRD